MSRYHTLYDSSSTAKFTTLFTGATSTSTVMTSRRITVIGNGTAHFMAFNTTTATTSSCVIPAGAIIDFNFVSGQRVAFIASSGNGYVTVIDAD
jgi:hypothetical protein